MDFLKLFANILDHIFITRVRLHQALNTFSLLHHKKSWSSIYCITKAAAVAKPVRGTRKKRSGGGGATPRHSFERAGWGGMENKHDIDLSKSATRNASTPICVVAFLPSKGWCCARGKPPPFLSAANTQICHALSIVTFEQVRH